MQHTDRRRRASFSARHSLGRIGLIALAVIAIGCGSTETTSTMTGVWGGRAAYVTPNDSFAFYFKQDGAEVEGWGILYLNGGPNASTRFGGAGTIAGRELTMALTDFDRNSSVLPGALYYLSGPSGRTQMNAVFEAGATSYPITLRLSRPAASDLVGTWVLTSTTGVAAPAGLLDTIIANADGRAYRHREGDYAFGTQAIWSRRGNYMVIDQEIGGLLRDSLLIQSPELQRTDIVSGGATRTDHYTRVSTSADLGVSTFYFKAGVGR
jgi:hypothetical protein